MRYDEPRLVWTSLSAHHALVNARERDIVFQSKLAFQSKLLRKWVQGLGTEQRVVQQNAISKEL